MEVMEHFDSVEKTFQKEINNLNNKISDLEKRTGIWRKNCSTSPHLFRLCTLNSCEKFEIFINEDCLKFVTIAEIEKSVSK